MTFKLVLHEKITDGLGNTIEIKIWRVPVSSHLPHGLKYSLVYIVNVGDRGLSGTAACFRSL